MVQVLSAFPFITGAALCRWRSPMSRESALQHREKSGALGKTPLIKRGGPSLTNNRPPEQGQSEQTTSRRGRGDPDGQRSANAGATQAGNVPPTKGRPRRAERRRNRGVVQMGNTPQEQRTIQTSNESQKQRQSEQTTGRWERRSKREINRWKKRSRRAERWRRATEERARFG